MQHEKKSITRWSKRNAISRLRNKEYNESDHRTWCDERNQGAYHFGLVPDFYKFASCTRYDIFHGRENVAKKTCCTFANC